MSGHESILISVLSDLMNPELLALMAIGTVVGIVVGMLPGLSATMAIALLLPFTFTMAPTTSISLLVAIFVGGISGGMISAILLRIPGTPNSVATLLDGYSMAQNGKAAQALGYATVASFFGTIISGLFLVALAPMLSKFALKFYFPEYVAAFFFALTAVVAVSGRVLSKGLISCFIGLLAATAGMSAIDGLSRFDFGVPAMLSGFPLVPALVGLFALSQIMSDAFKPKDDITTSDQKISFRTMLPPRKILVRQTPNIIRSSLIGTFVGILPAVGGGPAGLISYAQARNASKHPEKFGTGIEDGIIASEASNNATIGGALITALSLGIPGDTVTAMLLGGLMIQGVQPGPLIFKNNPDVVFSIYFSVFISAMFMIAFLLLTTRWIVKVLAVPKQFLLPTIFILASIGIYSINGQVSDLVVMCGFGLVGFVLEYFRYPLAPVILGFLLGPPFEANLRKMLGSSGSLEPLFTSPIALTLIAVALVFLGFSLRSQRRAARQEQ